ncbi:MAG: 16S rRNA processing protein RimM [Alphaproteobacteria bacterium]|nr:16S rRNA processing protein RimM [Alphaproteobacteria bacterium]
MICVGVIKGSHGVKGDVKLKSFTDNPRDITSFGVLQNERGNKTFSLTIIGKTKDGLRAHIEGIDDKDAADELKGTELFVSRDILPKIEDENEFYHADLIGLSVTIKSEDEGEEEKQGTLTKVHDFGAGDVLEIDTTDGETILVPFNDDSVPEIDIKGGKIVVIVGIYI